MPPINKVTNNTPRPSTGEPRSAWDVIDKVRVLVYGKSGTGKTTFWATFPKPILALVCSGGNQPGELRSIDTPENRKTISARIVDSVAQFRSELETANKFSTVVLDHGSGLQDLILKEILGLDDFLLAKHRQAGKGESWSVVSQQQYGQLSIQCKDLFRALLNLKINIVIVAQERTFGDEGTAEIIAPTVGAALTPSVTGWLNPACDYVVQTYLRPKMITNTTKIGDQVIKTQERGQGVEYCLRIEPHDIFMTKFRVPGGVKSGTIVNPTYEKMMRAIRGEKV